MRKADLLKILADARAIYNDIINGNVMWEGKPVRANLRSWSEERNGFCMVCLAGAYHYKMSGDLIHRQVAALTSKGMLPYNAMQFVIGDAETILDSIRYPLWFSHNMKRTIGGQRTDIFLRERIVLPHDHYHEELTPEQVVERLNMILALNTDVLDRAHQGQEEKETVSIGEHL